VRAHERKTVWLPTEDLERYRRRRFHASGVSAEHTHWPTVGPVVDEICGTLLRILALAKPTIDFDHAKERDHDCRGNRLTAECRIVECQHIHWFPSAPCLV
jgi:hypothetical protein